MKRIIILIAVLIITVTAISSCEKDEFQNISQPQVLNEWQKNLLMQEGLPTEFEELDFSQQQAIMRMYEMKKYLDDKYDMNFEYVGYIPAEFMEREQFFAYPKNFGTDSGRNIVTVETDENGDFKDDYKPPFLREYVEQEMRDFVSEYADKNNLGDTALFISQVFPTEFNHINQIQKQADGTDDFCWEFSCSATCFVHEDRCSKTELEELGRAFAEWDNERHIMAQMRFQLFNQDDIEKINASNMADYYVDENYQPYYFYSVDIFEKYIHDYDCQTNQGYDYEHQEFFNSGRKEKWFPVTVKDIKYKDETVIDEMNWCTWRQPDDNYFITEEAKYGWLKFPETDKFLKKIGWEFYTDNKSSFGWKKYNRDIAFYVVDSNQTNIYGELQKELICEINGQKTECVFDSDVVGRERVPQFTNGEFIVELSFSLQSYYELFGIIIRVDTEGTDSDNPYAKGNVIAIDRYI